MLCNVFPMLDTIVVFLIILDDSRKMMIIFNNNNSIDVIDFQAILCYLLVDLWMIVAVDNDNNVLMLMSYVGR